MKKVCVIGSINMDLVVETDYFVRPGETVNGKRFFTAPGGKGANQAVACSRLGGETAMIGKIGCDTYGKMYREVLNRNHINNGMVQAVKGENTGTAVIELEESGENRIIVVGGANALMDEKYVHDMLKNAEEYDIFLLQQEIPAEANEAAASALAEKGKVIILDPAPVREISPAFLEQIDYITPNEHELKAMTRCKYVEEGIKVLEAKGVGRVICKAGGDGAYFMEADTLVHVPAAEIAYPVDTTGAGDTFNGAFAYALAAGYGCYDAVRFANCAAGLSVMKAGAQTGMPSLDAVIQLMSRGGKP